MVLSMKIKQLKKNKTSDQLTQMTRLFTCKRQIFYFELPSIWLHPQMRGVGGVGGGYSYVQQIEGTHWFLPETLMIKESCSWLF